jgi:hypothetical protein
MRFFLMTPVGLPQATFKQLQFKELDDDT